MVRKYSDLNWCLYYNKVCDLSNFKHPGGNSLIVDVKGIFYCFLSFSFFLIIFKKLNPFFFYKGREISRFIYGNHILETSNIEAYIHTSSALKILNSQFVGNINYGETNILARKYNKNPKFYVMKYFLVSMIITNGSSEVRQNSVDQL